MRAVDAELVQLSRTAKQTSENLKNKPEKERVKAGLTQSKNVLFKAKDDFNKVQQQKLAVRMLTGILGTKKPFSLGRCLFRPARSVTLSLFLVGVQLFLAPLQSSAQSSLRSDGTLLVEGKEFFPLGYYSLWNYTHAQRMYQIQALGAGGFNTYYGEANNTSVSDYGLFLDEAHRQQVRVITKHFGVIGGPTGMELVNYFKGKPAVLGWNIADDANDFNPTTVLDYHNRVKAADPDHITYISGYDKDGIENFMNMTNLVGMQSYPLPQGCCNWNRQDPVPSPAPHLASTFWYMKWTVDKAAPFNRAIIGNLQTFSWENLRWPTAKEVDNMSYQSIVAGVKGIAYYTFEDGSSSIDKTHPNVWNATKRVASELKILAPVLLNGQRMTTVEDAGKAVYSAYWKYKSSVYIIVVNTSDSTKHVLVELPVGTDGPVLSVFPDRPRGMKLLNNILIGNVLPLDVHVYLVGMNTR